MMRKYGTWVLLALATMLAPARALAFRTTADTEGFDPEQPVRWRTAVRWRVDPAGVDGVSATALEEVASQAWSAGAAVPCASLSEERVAPGASTAIADGIVTIRGLGDEWTARGFPPDVPGRTELVYQRFPEGWRIVDADIFLNDAAFELVLDDAQEGQRLLLPIVQHELLHALGMEHCCGRLEGAPDCDLDAVCRTSTMYPFYEPTAQSVIGPDDAAGLCWLYPADACLGVSCDAGMSCVMGTCGPTAASCGGDVDCPRDAVCVAGACQPSASALGDFCSDDAVCAFGRCEVGRCSAVCSGVGTDCGPGYECDGTLCRPYLAEIGDACGTSADCTGGECLSGAGDRPVCTRACGGGQPRCPDGWQCALVDGEDVCAPSPTSCSVHGARSRATPFLLALVVIPLALARRRWTTP